VILVRHAMPEVLPGVAPQLWELGESGRAAAGDRPPSAWDDGYREVARRNVAGEALDGWEPHAAVIERVAAAAAGDVVVTHGLAMTLYLGAGARFWEELRFPDAWSALAGQLRRID
jgi:hypothetical protein